MKTQSLVCADVLAEPPPADVAAPLLAVVDSRALRFGPFSFGERAGLASVQVGGVPLALPPGCIAILHAIASGAGAPVAAPRLLDLMARRSGADATPTSLWACIKTLNAALASHAQAGYIAHFPDAGFALLVPQHHSGARGMQGLPARLASVIGCEDIASRIGARLAQHRLVSIVGAGGMGKTTVACVVAGAAAPRFADGVCFVDLAPLADARLLPGVLAQALCVTTESGEAIAAMAAFLRERSLLLVLDSCEHLIGAAADIAEQLLRAAPGLSVLATSREPLLATGEWLYRLGPMRLPPRSGGITASQALAFPSMQLFLARARERQPGFSLDDCGAAQASELCHRLDGIPLAIELAAARAATLGMAALVDQIGHRLLSVTAGRSTGADRHRTLGAMLDWSYELLAPREQRALPRLSLFRGEFTLAAASRLLADGDPLTPQAAMAGADSVLELLSKSLVSQREVGGLIRYRLLDTTRSYAGARLEQMVAPAERRRLRYRHARYLCELMTTAEQDWIVMTRLQWLDIYRMWIDDIRVALDWTFGADGDVGLGNELVISTFPLGHQASLTAEFGDRVAHAMALAPSASLTSTLLTTQLYILLCNVNAPVELAHTGLAAAARAADEAEAGNPLVQCRTALSTCMWAAAFIPGDFPVSLERCEILRVKAERDGDRGAELAARRMLAQSLHFLGRQGESREQAEIVLANAWRKVPLRYSPSQVDVRVSMRIMLARIAWIGGRFDEAGELAEAAVEHAGGDTASALAQSLAIGCIPLALWSGERDKAAALLQRLSAHASANCLHMWMSWSTFYRDVFEALEGDTSIAATARLLAPAARTNEHIARDHMVTFNTSLIAPDSSMRVQSGMVGWNAAEMLRAKGLRQRDAAPHSAALLLMRALNTARSQGALAWELRAACSLAQHWQVQERGNEARALLETLLARLPATGRPTADMRRAVQLLDRL